LDGPTGFVLSGFVLTIVEKQEALPCGRLLSEEKLLSKKHFLSPPELQTPANQNAINWPPTIFTLEVSLAFSDSNILN
jgi:hypothetical protein